MIPAASLDTLPDPDLIAELNRLAGCEHAATAALIACLAEMDARRLYLGEGCASLFSYCTQVLHLSEHAAYARIEAARAVRRFPVIVARLAAGDLTLTAVGLLRPHLTDANHVDVLNRVRHRPKPDVEQLVASLAPRPDVPSMIRKLPTKAVTAAVAEPFAISSRDVVSNPAASSQPGTEGSTQPVETKTVRSAVPTASPRTAIVTPLAPERYKVQFTIGRGTRDKLRRAQELLRHAVPDGDAAAIFDRALTLLVADLEKTKLAAVKRPRTTRLPARRSRHIPAAVRRAVSIRDQRQCGFVSPRGRCTERGFLEFHHVVPYADGGKATIENIQLRCRAHNQYESEQVFGPWLVKEVDSDYAAGELSFGSADRNNERSQHGSATSRIPEEATHPMAHTSWHGFPRNSCRW